MNNFVQFSYISRCAILMLDVIRFTAQSKYLSFNCLQNCATIQIQQSCNTNQHNPKIEHQYQFRNTVDITFCQHRRPTSPALTLSRPATAAAAVGCGYDSRCILLSGPYLLVVSDSASFPWRRHVCSEHSCQSR